MANETDETGSSRVNAALNLIVATVLRVAKRIIDDLLTAHEKAINPHPTYRVRAQTVDSSKTGVARNFIFPNGTIHSISPTGDVTLTAIGGVRVTDQVDEPVFDMTTTRLTFENSYIYDASPDSPGGGVRVIPAVYVSNYSPDLGENTVSDVASEIVFPGAVLTVEGGTATVSGVPAAIVVGGVERTSGDWIAIPATTLAFASGTEIREETPGSGYIEIFPGGGGSLQITDIDDPVEPSSFNVTTSRLNFVGFYLRDATNPDPEWNYGVTVSPQIYVSDGTSGNRVSSLYFYNTNLITEDGGGASITPFVLVSSTTQTTPLPATELNFAGAAITDMGGGIVKIEGSGLLISGGGITTPATAVHLQIEGMTVTDMGDGVYKITGGTGEVAFHFEKNGTQRYVARSAVTLGDVAQAGGGTVTWAKNGAAATLPVTLAAGDVLSAILSSASEPASTAVTLRAI